jgi:hypothetical protein
MDILNQHLHLQANMALHKMVILKDNNKLHHNSTEHHKDKLKQHLQANTDHHKVLMVSQAVQHLHLQVNMAHHLVMETDIHKDQHQVPHHHIMLLLLLQISMAHQVCKKFMMKFIFTD